MTDHQALREFVLARLGCSEPLLPGEHYEETPSTDWAYRRWQDILEETDYEVDTEGVERFLAELEARRERDFQAFHHGRDLLLEALPVVIEQPREVEPERRAAPRPPTVVRSQGRHVVRLRERVIARLGRPIGRLPGECYLWRDSPELWAMTALRDRVELEMSERAFEEAMVAIAAVRDRDRNAFEYGRAELLGMLIVELALPTRTAHA